MAGDLARGRSPITDLDIAHYLQPGDTVVVGQALAEPPILVEKLVEAARHVEGLTAFCGYSLSESWATTAPGRPHVRAWAAHAGLRKLGPERLDILPVHASRLETHFRERRLPADVVILQVGPADEDGFHNLGPTVDYCSVAAEHARAVLVEVNPRMPRTVSKRRLHVSKVTASITSTARLVEAPSQAFGDVESTIAENVASVVPDGATIQLGVGSLVNAVAQALRTRRGLRVRSGLVGDWLVDLHQAGALDSREASVVTGMALGSEQLYRLLDGSHLVEFATNAEQLRLVGDGDPSPFISINSSIEVDLIGQLNSEVAGGRYVGAVGGQGDFFRAAHRTEGGLAVVALASTTPSGGSRIVPKLDAAIVTSVKSDVDVVVTEWGVAHIQTASLRERVERLASVAHPRHRAALVASRPDWIQV